MKRLILCCDGTWNTADQDNDRQLCPTNVVKLAYRIAKRDGAVPQIMRRARVPRRYVCFGRGLTHPRFEPAQEA